MVLSPSGGQWLEVKRGDIRSKKGLSMSVGLACLVRTMRSRHKNRVWKAGLTMLEAPIHENDAERVASLRELQLLDTPPEERFDRIIRLLRHIFHVPMAYLSLVDAERQWFKSACGMDAQETPRAVSFCGHAIQ